MFNVSQLVALPPYEQFVDREKEIWKETLFNCAHHIIPSTMTMT